jgi:hypothetical protein
VFHGLLKMRSGCSRVSAMILVTAGTDKHVPDKLQGQPSLLASEYRWILPRR